MTNETTLNKKYNEQKKALALFEIILQNIDDGINVQNNKGELIYENDQATRMRKNYYSSKSKITDSNGNAVDKNEMPACLTLNDGVVHTKIIEITSHRKLPNVWLRIKAVPVFNKRDRLVYVVSTLRDITGRIMEEKRRDHFIAIGSHELRTPLAGIKVLNQVMQKLYLEKKFDQAKTFFYKIDSKVNTLTRIVQDFIEVEKIRAGKLDFAPTSFDFDEMMSSTIQDLQDIYRSHKITIHGQTKMQIIGDKIRLQEVINNLIGNARKYSPLSNFIEVFVTKDNKSITVAIKDYGIGLDAKFTPKIFQPFYRIKDPAVSKVNGLGLGLYISYKIIELHGGRMWVKSKIGAGSTFYFTIPLIIKKTKRTYEF